MGRLSRLYVGQGLRVPPVLGATPHSKVVSVTVSLLGSPTAADARPEQEEEDCLAAPEWGKEPEQESTHDSQTAGSRGVGTVLPTVLQEVFPELGVGAPGSVAGHLPGPRALSAYVQVFHHIVGYRPPLHLHHLHPIFLHALPQLAVGRLPELGRGWYLVRAGDPAFILRGRPEMPLNAQTHPEHQLTPLPAAANEGMYP